MTRDGGAHLWDRRGEFRESLKLAQLLLAPVAFVIEILPTSGSVFTDRLQSSVRRRVDEDVRPGRWNLQAVDAFQIFVCQTSAGWLVAETALRSAEPVDADVLETLEISHRNEIC